MSDYIRTLHEKRMRAWEGAKEILDRAASENRELSAEEETSYRRANEDINALDARINEYTDAEARKAEAERQFAEIAKTGPVREDKGSDVRSWLLGESGRAFVAEARTAPTGNLTKGTSSAGGATVPTSFYGRLVEHMIEVSGVLQAGPTVLNTESGENLEIPKTTAHSDNAALVSEAGTLTVNEPTFGVVTLGSYKFGLMLSVARELAEDTGVDLEGYLARQAGRALGNGFGAYLVTGTGSSQPGGVATAASAGVTGASTVKIPTADDMIDLFYSVIAPYRSSQSCGWLMNDTTVAQIRKLKDENGVYIWQPGLLAGSPDLILGKPVHTDPNMATDAAGNGKKTILFGDFSTYYVRQVSGIRFERSDDFAFDSDLITYRTLLRGDGAQVDTTGAIKAYVTGAAS
jgi:HK97 family phage major capsid protein